MSAGLREQRDDMSTAFAGAVILHAAVGAALILFAPKAEPKLIVNSVPVTIVSDMPDSAPDVGVPIPLPAEPAPVETPAPTPPPPPPPAPKPPPKTQPTPRTSNTGTQRPPRPPAPAQSQSGDDLLADLSSDPTLTERRPPNRNKSRNPPPPAPNTKSGSQNQGRLSIAARNNAMAAIAEQAAQHWRLDCAAPALSRIRPKLRFRLNSSGRLVGDPQVVDGQSDPSWQAAARGAVTAMKNAQPFRDVPEELIGPELTLNFIAVNACRGR